MSASLQEIQVLADQLLELLGTRMRSGQIVIHVNDGFVQRVETNTVHKPTPAPAQKNRLTIAGR
jgi:hypothetical protein